MGGQTNKMNQNLNKNAWSPKMIVFDKDGTLGDCTQALHTWSKRMTNCITEECQNTNLQPDEIDQLIAEFHHTIGWNSVDECMLPSSYLSSGTWEQILDATALVLESYGNGFIDNIRERVEFWNKNLGDIHANDKPLVDDLPGLMSDLKQQCEGVIIAICTSDDRRATKACVKNWKLEGHIDFSICGDEVSEGKPSARPLLVLCKQAQVSPQDCIVVGDTSADIGMGRNANAGLIVGVLTGTGTAEYLMHNGADAIIPNIEYLSRLVGFTPTRGRRSSSDLTAISSSTEGDVSVSSLSD